jgi:hypothetical protein
MPTKSPKPAQNTPAAEPLAFPELEQAMRVIVSVPKSAVEASIAKDQKRKAKKKLGQ